MGDYITKLGFIEKFQVLLGKDKDEDGIIYKEERLLKNKNSSMNDYSVDDSTKIICDEAFAGSRRLENINLPDSVLAIGEEAFKGCKNLTSLSLPFSLEHLGNYSIPKNCKIVEIKSNNISCITGDVFEECQEQQQLEPKPNFRIIKVPFSKIDTYKKKFGKQAQITNLNYKHPVAAGLNSSNEPLTYVNMSLKVSGGIKIIKIDDLNIVISEPWNQFGIRIYDKDNKTIFSDDNLLVDGDIKESSLIRKNKQIQSPELKEAIEKFGGPTQSIVKDIIISLLQKRILKKESLETQAEIIEFPENNPITINFKVRLRDSIFDSSKLNFIKLNDENKIVESKIGQISFNGKYLLSLISYDNVLYDGYIDPKEIENLKDAKISDVYFRASVKNIEDTEIAYFNIQESEDKNLEKGIYWFKDKEKTAALMSFTSRNLYPFIDPKTSKHGYTFIPAGADVNLNLMTNDFFYTKNGKDVILGPHWLLTPVFDFAERFHEGLAAVKIKNKWGFINKDGNLIIEAKFNDVRNFNKGRAFVKLGNEWGIISYNGKYIVRPKFDAIYRDSNNNHIRTYLNGKWSSIDNYGKSIENSK